MYDQLRRDWVTRFTTLLPENHPRAKSGVSSRTSSSLPMGWVLQKPRTGWTRYSSKMKNYLKARIDAGEESGCKADPQQVSIDMISAGNKDHDRPIVFKGRVADENPNPSVLFKAICLKEKATQCFNASTSSTGWHGWRGGRGRVVTASGRVVW